VYVTEILTFSSRIRVQLIRLRIIEWIRASRLGVAPIGERSADGIQKKEVRPPHSDVPPR